MRPLASWFGVSLLFLAGACGRSARPDAPASAESAQATTPVAAVHTAQIRLATIPEYLELPAHLEPDPTRVVRVFAPAGGRITELRVAAWGHVEKGELLALVESSDVARAAADLRKALADYQVKQATVTRTEALFAHGAIAAKDLQQAQADVQAAQAEVDATRSTLRVLGVDPDHPFDALRVIAPRSGVVLDVGVSMGEFSKSLDAPQPLCTIADLRTVWAIGEMYERDLAAVRSGQPAEVTLSAYPGQRWSGRIAALSSSLDPTTRTLRVRVVLENADERLKPAMFGAIRVLQSTASGILVPSVAVIRQGSDTFVFVQRSTGGFERRTVSLGRLVADSAEITAGLKPGETIATEGALLLRAGG
jgi:cobalt-zinc-cadmium efflux system membrane fusion protein